MDEGTDAQKDTNPEDLGAKRLEIHQDEMDRAAEIQKTEKVAAEQAAPDEDA